MTVHIPIAEDFRLFSVRYDFFRIFFVYLVKLAFTNLGSREIVAVTVRVSVLFGDVDENGKID